MELQVLTRLAERVHADSEGQDVALALGGDHDAFERLYRTHVGRVHALALRMAGAEAAEDLTQEVFIRVYSKLESFRGDSAFGTWLHRLAVNLILSRRATMRKREQRYVSGDATFEGIASRPATPGLRMDLENAMQTLPDGARQVFILFDVEGYGHDEIASMMGITSGTSKSQLHRARMLLRDQLT